MPPVPFGKSERKEWQDEEYAGTESKSEEYNAYGNV